MNTDFTNARSSNPTTAAAGKAAITTAITSRIAGYVSGTNSIDGAVRATQYAELDVYNESYNTGANASDFHRRQLLEGDGRRHRRRRGGMDGGAV